MSEAKKLRKKSEILESLGEAINKSDKEYVKQIYSCCGSLVKNGFVSESNPATYVGWLRLDNGDILRVEGEPRPGKDGKVSLALKGVTVPHAKAVELGIDNPKIPDYQSPETVDFLNQ